jgi:hypothetical protein
MGASMRVHHEEVDGVGTDVEHTKAHTARLLVRRDALVTEPDVYRNIAVLTCANAGVVHMPTRLSTGPDNPRAQGATSGTMAEDDELERRVRKLTVENAEMRWLALRLDDVKDIREVLREHTTRFDSIDRKLHDHDARFDSIDQALHDHSAQFDSIFRTLHEFNARFDSTDLELQEVRGRFASVDAVLRSLHQMVGQVLERLPEESPG